MRLRDVTASVLALSLAACLWPVPALADTEDELAAAAAQLESLGADLTAKLDELAETTELLENTQYEIDEKSDQIDQTQAELATRQGELSDLMRSSYKTGPTSPLEFLLGSSSFEDLFSRIRYLESYSDYQSKVIGEVSQLESTLREDLGELERRQSDQQQQVETLNAQTQEYESRVAEAQSVYNQLDAQLQAELEAQRNAEIQAALEAAERAEQQQDSQEQGGQTGDQSTPPVSEPDGDQDQTESEQDQNESVPDQGQDQGQGSQDDGSSLAGGGVATALAQVGKPYGWASAGPNSFDCSGLVCFSYGYARGRSTYDMINSLQSTGDWKTSLDQLNYGDLVFPNSGHVGIYLGNGQMVHASRPGVGVVVGPVYSFYGGGSYY